MFELFVYAIICHQSPGGDLDQVNVDTFGVKDPRRPYTVVKLEKNYKTYSRLVITVKC